MKGAHLTANIDKYALVARACGSEHTDSDQTSWGQHSNVSFTNFIIDLALELIHKSLEA